MLLWRGNLNMSQVSLIRLAQSSPSRRRSYLRVKANVCIVCLQSAFPGAGSCSRENILNLRFPVLKWICCSYPCMTKNICMVNPDNNVGLPLLVLSFCLDEKSLIDFAEFI